MAQQKIYLANGEKVICDTTKTTSEGTFRSEYIYNVFCGGYENYIVAKLHARENMYDDYIMRWTFPSGVYLEMIFKYSSAYKIWDYSIRLTDGITNYPVYVGVKAISDIEPSTIYYLRLYMVYNITTDKFAISVDNYPYTNPDPSYTIAQNMTTERMSKYSNNLTSDTRVIYPNLITDYCNNDVKILGDAKYKPDPYKNGGYSGENGGGGNFDETSDAIALPELPTLTAQNTGFISIYSPLAGEIQALSTYMWGDDFITSVKKLYANPADSLIMLAIVPIAIPSAVDSDVKIAGISTGLTMHKALSQFIEIDCGTIEINEFFGSCFDYQPYTQIQIYCPFSGYHDIDVDICMNSSLNLRYYFDILSGTFIAYLLVNNTVMYQWAGQAITMLPTSSYNIDALIKGAVAATASVAGAVATGGALAPIAGAMTVASVTSMKPQVSHGGDITASSALLSVREPHVIIKRPKQVLPQDYNVMSGYPSMINAVLSDLTGYTEIYSVHLSDMSCTDDEKAEIERLLKEGVIL